ncbi:hypothetical protein FRB99_008860 [Tulasnella sp. 403]|nr:hypothetical protein FRB99_008860 [Tulasnella sp. 403]
MSAVPFVRTSMDAIPLDPNALEIRLDNILRQLEQHRIDRNRISFPEDVEAVSGGYGIVHRGSLDAGSASSTIVAVKQLRPIGNRGQRLRVAVSFVRELAIWANLNHPNVLPFVGFFLNPTLEDAWLLSTFIFNGDDRHALLCDFGLAKVVEDCPSGLTTSRFGQRGSLRYLSPELLIDPNPHRTLQSDVWAFGCLLLEILLDIMPYNNINVEHALILQIVQGAKPAPLEELPLPPEISALLAQCWQSATSRPDIQHCLETLQAYADSLALSASHLVIEEPETEVDYSSALNQESSPTIRARRRETSPEPPKSVKLDLVREIKGFSDIDGVRFSKDGLLVAAAYPQTIAIYYSITGEKKWYALLQVVKFLS